MEGSGPQQCQAHWHAFHSTLTAGASRAGGVERAMGARGGAEMAAAPPVGSAGAKELPGHTWCQTGGADPLQGGAGAAPGCTRTQSGLKKSSEDWTSSSSQTPGMQEDPGDTSGLLFMWDLWVTPSAGLGM